MINSIPIPPIKSIDHGVGEARAHASASGGGCGRSPLDLINGHLTDYIPVTRSLPSEFSPKGWFIPSEGIDHSKQSHYVAKIQAFKAGGYEVTCQKIDIVTMALRSHGFPDLVDGVQNKRPPREKDVRNHNDIVSSINRAKKTIRYRIKSMGCDRMLTVTIREKDHDTYRTKEDWAILWDKFRRLCEKAGIGFEYVAVLERHKKGNLHLHAAIVGHFHINTARRIWLLCVGGGKGCGNIDVRYRKDLSPIKRRSGLSKYVSKYISKQIDGVEFNKKRYWCTKHSLQAPRRIILRADEISEGVIELCEFLGLDCAAVQSVAYFYDVKTTKQLPGGKGFWFEYDDDIACPVPF